jgi:hypothetical protein
VPLEKENTVPLEKENTVPLEKENTVPLEKENTAASLEEEEKEEKAEEPGTTLSNDQLYAICAQLVYDARLSLTLSKKLFEKINNNEEILAKFTEINDSLDSLYKDQIFSQISDENQKFYKPVSSIDNAIDKAIEDNSFEGATPTSIIVLTIAQLAALAYGSAVMMGGKKKKTKGRKPRSQKPNKKTKRYLKQK